MFVESDTFASPTCTYIFVTVISSSLQESDVFGSTCMMLSIGTSFSMDVLKTKELSPAYKYTQQIFELLFTGYYAIKFLLQNLDVCT